jgi:hypothetical protein
MDPAAFAFYLGYDEHNMEQHAGPVETRQGAKVSADGTPDGREDWTAGSF